jgi:hypothetical protein
MKPEDEVSIPKIPPEPWLQEIAFGFTGRSGITVTKLRAVYKELIRIAGSKPQRETE